MLFSSPVTVVTVTYNSSAMLRHMLASLPEGVAAIVVDNASSDLPALRHLCAAHGAKLLANDRNLGFGTACNQGAALATTEFLIFLNPDAELTPSALDELVAAARRCERAAAFNPRIENPDGSVVFKRSSPLIPRKERGPRSYPSEECEVSILSGAALFVRRADFTAVGGFDENIFLYHEDHDLALRLRHERGPLMVAPNAIVRHIGGASSEPSLETTALKAFHIGRSRVYAARKHNRPAPFAHAVLSAIQGLLALDMLISKRRRVKNLAYLKGVMSTLREGGTARGRGVRP